MRKIILFFTFLSLAVVLLADELIKVEFKEGTAGKSSLKMVSGVPFGVFVGTPQEIGEAQGKLLGKQFAQLSKEYLEKAALFCGGKKVLLERAKKMEQFIPARYIDEMKGFAKAAEAEYEVVLLASAYADVYRSGGCSTIAVSGEASGGAVLVGRNLDFAAFGVLHKYTLISIYRPKGFKSFVSVTLPGLCGVLSGMNEDGLTAAVMEVCSAEDGTEGMPSIILFRRLLEEAATVDEALKILQSEKRCVCNNLILADRSGAAAVAEIGPKRFEVRRAQGGAVFATNHFREKVEVPPECSRYALLEKFVKEKQGKIDVAAIKEVLKSVSVSILTIQSMVFEPNTLKIHLASGEVPATKSEFKEFALAEYLKEKEKVKEPAPPEESSQKK
jgi:predicted choloylglycine hydrolase